ncbi:MAG: hypothetical protein ABI035_00875 [Gemmatimonadaceae bacterium]
MRAHLTTRLAATNAAIKASVAAAFTAAFAAFVAVVVLALPTTLRAQSGQETIFLLLPVGARAVGMGEAVVAQRGGSDMLWWNPAALAGNDSAGHEIALHHSTTVVGQGNALGVVWPFQNKSVIGFAVNILDLGQQTLTDDQGNGIGVATPTDYSIAASYAAPLMSWLTVGATAKHVEAGIPCSGVCTGLGLEGSRSNGLDLGLQLRPTMIPLTIGAAARNLGVTGPAGRPGRLDLGADYLVVAFERGDDRVEVHGAASLISTVNFDSTSSRFGTDVIVDERLHVRAGYIRDPANGSGGSIGVGLQSGKLVFDLGRTYGGLTGTNDKPPTYFSLRYLW